MTDNNSGDFTKQSFKSNINRISSSKVFNAPKRIKATRARRRGR